MVKNSLKYDRRYKKLMSKITSKDATIEVLNRVFYMGVRFERAKLRKFLNSIQ